MKFVAATLLLVLASSAKALCLAPLCTCGVSTSTVPFGSYNPMDGLSQDITGSIALSCTAVAGLLIPYTVALSPGSSQSFSSRYMLSGMNRLYYNLYSDALRTVVWGDGSAGSTTVNGTLVLSVLGTVNLTGSIYGRIQANQKTAVPGIYADTIVVTVTYY